VEERRLKEAFIAVGVESPQRWRLWRPISPTVSPVVMEIVLAPSMKREFVIFAGNLKVIVERRLDGHSSLFWGKDQTWHIFCIKKVTYIDSRDNDDYFNGKRLTN
jgi:hypothetical protein